MNGKGYTRTINTEVTRYYLKLFSGVKFLSYPPFKLISLPSLENNNMQVVRMNSDTYRFLENKINKS